VKLASCLLGATLLAGAAPIWGHSYLRPSGGARQTRPANQTFIGQITQNPDNRNLQDEWVLYDQTKMTNYFVDGNEDFAKYVGEKIEVTGSLNQANDTIHAASVNELNGSTTGR
jgi:hypothetical protein